MDLSPAIPLLYYGASSVITIHSLRQPKGVRLLVLAPVLLLSFLALANAKKLSWPFGLDSTFASMVVFYLPYSIKILALDELPSHPEVSTQRWSFVDCYRIWNNPRNITPRTPLLDRSKESKGKRGTSRTSFAVRMAVKMAAMWAFDSLVFRKVLYAAFANVSLHSFAPEMEFLTLGRFLQMSASEHRLRAVMSVQWIWSAYFFLEFYHALLAIVFVSICRFDQPDEWPALFGSALETDSIRGFWGRFWHRLTIPTYASYAQIISRKILGFAPGSRAEKTLIPMCIFTFSGVSHSLVGWAMGDAALERDTIFFVVNFAAAAAEIAVSKARKSGSFDLPLPALSEKVGKMVGMIGVFVFFYTIVPMWMYPKVYASLLPLMG